MAKHDKENKVRGNKRKEKNPAVASSENGIDITGKKEEEERLEKETENKKVARLKKKEKSSDEKASKKKRRDINKKEHKDKQEEEICEGVDDISDKKNLSNQQFSEI